MHLGGRGTLVTLRPEVCVAVVHLPEGASLWGRRGRALRAGSSSHIAAWAQEKVGATGFGIRKMVGRSRKDLPTEVGPCLQ